MDDGRRYDIPTLLGLHTVDGVISVALALTCLLILWFGLASTRHGTQMQGALAMAFVANVALFMLYLDVFGTLRTDEPVWHASGVEARELLLGERGGDLSARGDKQGYAWLAGLMYLVFGEMPMVLITLNVALHFLGIASLVRSVCNFGTALKLPSEVTRWAGRTSAWALAIAPGVLLWGPQVMRETLSLFLVCLGLEGLTLLMKGRLLKGSALALGACWMLYQVRGGVGVGLTIAVLVGAVLAVKLKGRFGWERRVSLLMASGVLGGAAMVVSGIDARLSGASLAQEMQYLSRTADTGFGGSYGESPWATVLTTNLPRVLFGPFPWEWSAQFGIVLAMADALVWIPFLFLAGRLALDFSGEQRRLIVAVLGFTAVLVGVLAVGVSNYGMLSRLRPIALPPLIMLGTFSLATVWARGLRLRTPSNAVRPSASWAIAKERTWNRLAQGRTQASVTRGWGGRRERGGGTLGAM